MSSDRLAIKTHHPNILEHTFYMGVDAPRLSAPHGLVAASASKLWAERVNPIWWQTRTWLGDCLTEDRLTWRTMDGPDWRKSSTRPTGATPSWPSGTTALVPASRTTRAGIRD